MGETIVDGLHRNFSEILDFLNEKNEVSWRNVVDDNFRKIVLMAAASHFEQSMANAVLNFVKQVTAENHPLTWLVNNKVVSRQYHTWFDWDAINANQFFGLFGDAFKNNMKKKVDNDSKLNSSIQAFMEIGRERNRLVHQDFGNFPLEKTYEEIYMLYSEATLFVEQFPDALKMFSEKELKKKYQDD